MTTTTLRRLATLLATGALVLAIAPSAGAGTFQVNYGPALGAGWSTLPVGGMHVAGNTATTTGQPIAAGVFGGLRFDTGSDEVTVTGGSVELTHAVGSGVRAEVLAGGSTTYSGSGSQARSVAIPSTTGRSLRVGLGTTAAFGGAGANSVTIGSASLLLTDATGPVIALDHVPDPLRWYGPDGCVRVAFDAADAGSGIIATLFRSMPGNVVIDSWSMPSVLGPRPGVAAREYDGCIPDTLRPDGTATFQFVAMNGSGDYANTFLTIRTDRTAPTVTGGPAERVDLEAPYAIAPFTVRDVDGSGLKRVEARVDGVVVSTTMAEGGVVHLAAPPLGVGLHVVDVTATDNVGNVTTTERRVSVVDTTAPTLERVTPGDGGDGSFELLLRARDAVSGIRASSWTVTVNGAAVVGSGDAEQFRATVESLAPGVHRIEAAVTDLAGNRSTITFTYVVNAPAGMPADIASQVTQLVTSQTAQTVVPATGGAADAAAAPGSAAAAGAASPIGAWVVRGATSSATFGMPAEATVFVARAGRAVAGRRVAVQRAGVELATATTGSDGLARVGYTAGMPGEYRLVVEGLDPIALQLAVAPRVLASSARSAKRGAKVRVTGRVQPALAGHPLVLEARSGSGWFIVRRGLRTARGGTFATTFTANARGKFQLRVRVAPHAGWQAATSASKLTLSVR